VIFDKSIFHSLLLLVLNCFDFYSGERKAVKTHHSNPQRFLAKVP